MRARQCTRGSVYMKKIFIVVFLVFGLVYIIGMYLWNWRVSTFIEGFNNNNTELVYYPQKKSLNENLRITFKINDFMRDAIEVPESIKIYKKLIHKPSSEKSGNNAVMITNYGEYSKRIEDTEIYKKFTTDIKPNETKLLDIVYASLFDSTKISGMELTAIQKHVSEKMSIVNRQHNLVKYFMIHSPTIPYLSNEFSAYFATLINAYKSQQNQLDAIKTFFYKIIGPSFAHAELIKQYSTNKSLYSTKDDILFILNTTKEYLEKVKIDDFEHTSTNTLYVFKDDKKNYADNTLSVESVTLFTMGTLLMNIYDLVFSTENGKNSPHIKMTPSEFTSMFEAYLKKKFPDTKTNSMIVFAINPNNAPSIP
jgi:hypothetical protein